MVWRAEEIGFDTVDDLTVDPVTTIAVKVPNGSLTLMAAIEVSGSVLRLRGLHIQGSAANRIGAANLIVLARVVMERIGVDGLEVEGAVRTTWTRPGHRPSVVRFARGVGAAASGRGDAE